ncbi:hypothetical protein G9A89_013225 [Geosiphon pyriformis]|nr:hypothetical protein G9A89_013225 [Geosiphon pyriformis]
MAAKPRKLSDLAALESFLNKFDTFLLDCDGIDINNDWKSLKIAFFCKDALFPGVFEALKFLRSKEGKNHCYNDTHNGLGKQLLFVTNNSTKSRASYLAKFKRLNIEAYEDEIFGSAYTAAYYLKNILNFPKEKKVYVIGESGITNELDIEGIRHCGSSSDNQEMKGMDLSEIIPDPEVGAVLCGFDLHFNYRKLAKAFTYLRSNQNCIFLLTNDDITYPSNGTLFPGSGSLAAPLITALNRKPDGVMGKPNKPMLDCIIQKFNLNVDRTCMIGDRLDTDIQFGINGGASTLLVLTGVSTEQEILSEDATIIPDYYITSFGEFAKLEQ